MTNISTYLINLARAPERRERMDQLLSALQLDYTVIEAVDGKLLARDTLESVVHADPGHEPVPAQVGCFLSHREAWRRVSTGKSRYGLILEDDLIFAANFGELIADLETGPPDIDILRLEGRHDRVWARKPLGKLSCGYSVYKLDWSTHGTACYLVSSGCAKRLLEEVRYYVRPVDDMLFRKTSPHWSSFRTYSTSPAACYQHAFFKGEKEATDFLTTSIRTFERTKREKNTLRRISDEISRLTNKVVRHLTGWRRISNSLHPVGAMNITSRRK